MLALRERLPGLVDIFQRRIGKRTIPWKQVIEDAKAARDSSAGFDAFMDKYAMHGFNPDDLATESPAQRQDRMAQEAFKWRYAIRDILDAQELNLLNQRGEPAPKAPRRLPPPDFGPAPPPPAPPPPKPRAKRSAPSAPSTPQPRRSSRAHGPAIRYSPSVDADKVISQAGGITPVKPSPEQLSSVILRKPSARKPSAKAAAKAAAAVDESPEAALRRAMRSRAASIAASRATSPTRDYDWNP
jgi:hypothetical protein